MYYIFYEEKYIAIHFCGGTRHTSQLRSFFSFEQKHNSQSLMALVVKLAAFLRYQKYWPLIGNWAKKAYLINSTTDGWRTLKCLGCQKNQYRPNRGLTRPEWSQMWFFQDHKLLTKSLNCFTVVPELQVFVYLFS